MYAQHTSMQGCMVETSRSLLISSTKMIFQQDITDITVAVDLKYVDHLLLHSTVQCIF